MTCACGTPIGPRALRCKRCRCNEAQARYIKSSKGRIVEARYVASAKGRAKLARARKRRIFVGRVYRGRVSSIDLARQINDHIKERVIAFKQRQSDRKETESPAAG